ncbi:MAG: HAD-IA family hydrolase [Hyphomonadaceae bacterium]|nr:MAG: 2-haloacid dehalogenase [Caulobacteraceae bacterium]MBT9447239.1 HAD-IA family hydrolase [Hyphomonadaceae bacterium]TPW04212.1 MAG: 2-haloacid dehalogenase [Alphaproteobacteria bacterium]
MPANGMRPKAVLFDYGNVLVRWDPRNLYRKLFADPAEMEWFLANVCTMDWHLRHDSGEPMAVTTAELAAQHPKYEFQIRAWDAQFGDMIDGEIEGAVALLDAIKAQGLKVGVLTNMPADQAWTCFNGFSRWAALDTIIVSGFVKAAKPGAAAYRLALHALDREPHEVFFVDDSAKNVAAAAALGLHAHLFTTPEAFADALHASGFLS